MSLYNQFADKPWMQPIRYTSDADASHGGAGPARQTELVNGEAVVIDGREHYQPTEFGDGRPTGMVDNTPMNYRQAEPCPVIDLDDHDELDTATPEYVPYVQHLEPSATPVAAARQAPQTTPSRPQPNTPQLMNNPYPAKDPHRYSKLIVDMHGVSAPPGFTATAIVSIGNTLLCEADAEDLKLAANFFTAWARMLSTIRN